MRLQDSGVPFKVLKAWSFRIWIHASGPRLEIDCEVCWEQLPKGFVHRRRLTSLHSGGGGLGYLSSIDIPPCNPVLSLSNEHVVASPC